MMFHQSKQEQKDKTFPDPLLTANHNLQLWPTSLLDTYSVLGETKF